MTTGTVYQTLLNQKRTWTPAEVTAGAVTEGSHEVLQKALALRCLEIPVGDFITDACKGDLPVAEGVMELLKSNITDEENHDVALNFAAAAHGTTERYEREAGRIQKAWLEFDAHPVLKAGVLERSIFFVLLPIFRQLGDTGLRTISQDISRDEIVHVKANTKICQELGLKPTKAMNALRRATMQWVLDALPESAEDQFLSRDYWMKQSDMLFAKGKSEMGWTRASRMPAFFETSAENLPMYS